MTTDNTTKKNVCTKADDSMKKNIGMKADDSTKKNDDVEADEGTKKNIGMKTDDNEKRFDNLDISDRRKRILSLSNEESRRVTREAARGALFRLMLDTNIKNIRIVDLVKVAGISRSAFYRNYHSVEDVLLDAVDISIREVSQAIGKRTADNWKLILLTVRNHERLLKALSDAGLFHVLLDRMNAGYDRENYIITMWNGLIFNVIQRWVQCGIAESDEQMLMKVEGEMERLAKGIEDGWMWNAADRTASENGKRMVSGAE